MKLRDSFDGKTFTMKQLLNAKGAKKGFYCVVELDSTVYAVQTKLVEQHIDEDDFKFKVSNNGDWLVPAKGEKFVLDKSL